MARNGAASPQWYGRAPRRDDLVRGEQRVVGVDLGAAVGQALHQRQRLRVGELVHALSIGQAEHEDRRAVEPVESVGDGVDGAMNLRIVDPPGRAHDLQIRVGAQDQVRVHGDAVAAHADAGLVNVRVRLAVGRLDHFLDVHSGPVRGSRELVGEGDVDVAVGSVGELREFGGLGRAHGHDLGVEHGVVEGRRAPGRFGTDAADELGIGRQVGEDGAGEQPLGGEGDEEVALGDQATRRLQPRREPATGLADRQCGLEDHGEPGVDPAGDRVDGRIHVAVIGLVVVARA